MNEIRDLIAFYDEHGWDWTDAACFVLIRQKFGSWQELTAMFRPNYRRKGKS